MIIATRGPLGILVCFQEWDTQINNEAAGLWNYITLLALSSAHAQDGDIFSAKFPSNGILILCKFPL